MSRRGGFTAVEALLALLLLLLLLQAGWSVTAGMARASAEVAERAESIAAARATGWILQEELEGARAGPDVGSPAGDSIALRAFRAVAIACGPPHDGALVVRWSGLRAPDPAKDSVLVLLPSGGWVPLALRHRAGAAGGCARPGVGVEERWTLSDSIRGAALLRVFERGSYHLSDDALRYRIGLGGRQPLTPATLDPSRSALSRSGSAGLVVTVATRGAHRRRGGPEWRRTFALGGGW